jgi:hypothetical protein
MTSPQGGNCAIDAGALLVEKNTLLPEPFRLENHFPGSGWARIADNGDANQAGRSLADAGWTFFYAAGTIRASALGFQSQNMIQAALQRLLTKVRLQRCNSLEIDEVATHSFWGLPYVSVSGHARHIQKGMSFAAGDLNQAGDLSARSNRIR